MAARRRKPALISQRAWVLEDGDTANQGEPVGFDTATGTVRPMGSSATQKFLGFAAETLVGNGVKKLEVSVPKEIAGEWFANAAAPNDVDASTIGSDVYFSDAKTVSTLATGHSVAGMVLDYDATANLVLVRVG